MLCVRGRESPRAKKNPAVARRAGFFRLGVLSSSLFADHDGFEFEPETEAILNVVADVPSHAQDVLTRRAAEIHENEGVALVDAHRAPLGSLPARGFDEPSGG